MSRTIVGWPTIPTNSATTCRAFASNAAALSRRTPTRELIGEYDEIEIPPVKPYVIRHRRFACRCAHCGVAAKAPAPAVATTTPFGPRIHALAIYLKGFQALSYERLRGLFRDAFGLSVSEGALMNMFIRSHPRFKIEAEKAKAIVRAAQVVASDETGVRIEGTNSYHWVFHCKDAVVHQPDYSRAARVVDEMMAGISRRSGFRIAIRRSKSMASGIKPVWRIWPATRLSRSSTAPMICPSGSSFGLARRSTWPRPSPISPPRRSRGRKRDAGKTARQLFWPRRPDATSPGNCKPKSARARNQLLTFCDYPGEVDVTNNTSERKLRPCVIQRKVTNGYRAMWAAEAEADVRTTVDTARLNGANPFMPLA